MHDALSSPWFLEENDAVSYFREKNDIEEKSYGEALIEVRCIKNIGLYFLEKRELDSGKTGDFLTNITDDTIN